MQKRRYCSTVSEACCCPLWQDSVITPICDGQSEVAVAEVPAQLAAGW